MYHASGCVRRLHRQISAEDGWRQVHIGACMHGEDHSGVAAIYCANSAPDWQNVLNVVVGVTDAVEADLYSPT